MKVRHAHPWVVAHDGDTLYRGKFLNGGDGAVERLRDGASPKDVFGRPFRGGRSPNLPER